MRDKLGSAFCSSSPFATICAKAVKVGPGAKSAKLFKSGLLAMENPNKYHSSRNVPTPTNFMTKERELAPSQTKEENMVKDKFKSGKIRCYFNI